MFLFKQKKGASFRHPYNKMISDYQLNKYFNPS
jgi:hypothetical protein